MQSTVDKLCFLIPSLLPTSKSTFSPSGILGGMRFGMMNGLEIKRKERKKCGVKLHQKTIINYCHCMSTAD